jgi:hypothetical protein
MVALYCPMTMVVIACGGNGDEEEIASGRTSLRYTRVSPAEQAWRRGREAGVGGHVDASREWNLSTAADSRAVHPHVWRVVAATRVRPWRSDRGHGGARAARAYRRSRRVKLVRFVTLRRDTARFSICGHLRNLRMKGCPQMDADLRRCRNRMTTAAVAVGANRETWNRRL